MKNKSKSPIKKLTLNKYVVVVLNKKQQSHIIGGNVKTVGGGIDTQDTRDTYRVPNGSGPVTTA